MEHVKTFEHWLRDQQLDVESLGAELEVQLRAESERIKSSAAAHDITATVRKAPPSGEYRYAVDVEDEGHLWLTLWVRRSPQGEYFVMYPRGRGTWNPHASYHVDGRYH